MARATTHSTVVTGMDKDWQLATDSLGSTLLEDGILECQDLMVDDNYESTSIWADSSRTLSWHNEVTGLSQSLEQDEFAFPLPSPLERAWVDTSNYLEPCDFIANGSTPDLCDGPGCTLVSDDDVITCGDDDNSSGVTSQLLCESNFIQIVFDEQQLEAINADDEEQALTVDRSLLEQLLVHGNESEDAFLDCDAIDQVMNSCEELEIFPSNSEEGDSDWSYTGEKGRRRCVKRRRLYRAGPYQRPSNKPKDQRKKDQNKNAAIRYRERKRTQEHNNEVECDQLEQRNRELREQVEAMSHEVKVLRSLVVDIFRKNP